MENSTIRGETNEQGTLAGNQATGWTCLQRNPEDGSQMRMRRKSGIEACFRQKKRYLVRQRKAENYIYGVHWARDEDFQKKKVKKTKKGVHEIDNKLRMRKRGKVRIIAKRGGMWKGANARAIHGSRTEWAYQDAGCEINQKRGTARRKRCSLDIRITLRANRQKSKRSLS